MSITMKKIVLVLKTAFVGFLNFFRNFSWLFSVSCDGSENTPIFTVRINQDEFCRNTLDYAYSYIYQHIRIIKSVKKHTLNLAKNVPWSYTITDNES